MSSTAVGSTVRRVRQMSSSEGSFDDDVDQLFDTLLSPELKVNQQQQQPTLMAAAAAAAAASTQRSGSAGPLSAKSKFADRRQAWEASTRVKVHLASSTSSEFIIATAAASNEHHLIQTLANELHLHRVLL